MERSYQQIPRDSSQSSGSIMAGKSANTIGSRPNAGWGWKRDAHNGVRGLVLPTIAGGRSILGGGESSALDRAVMQPKFRINAPGDRYEQEADRVAEQVVGEEPRGDRASHIGEISPPALSANPLSPTLPTSAPESVQMVTGGTGEALDGGVRKEMEKGIGHDFSGVRVHRDARAAASADEIGARAYTVGSHVAFGHGEYRPQTSDGRRLIAHELTHVVQQRGGGDVVQRQDKPRKSDRPDPTIESWIGSVNTWSIALRRTPDGNTIADLPKGSYAWVIGTSGGWLQVNAAVNGKELSGYVSQELLDYVQPAVLKSYEQSLRPGDIDVAKAYLIMNQMEIATVRQGGSPLVSLGEQRKVGIARQVLLRSGKYSVDPQTYHVSLIQRAGAKVKIDTIEDFILFVEDVERTYPSATINEVVSEIREIWFADTNWELLVSSHGITNGKSGKAQFEDIETEPNPIAKKYNMKDLAPGVDPTTGVAPKKRVSTRYGPIEISHVIAGIDAALSPMPQAYPKSLLADKGHDNDDAGLKYSTLMNASGGVTRDFATWSGDLGQGYADYLYERYFNDNEAASLHSYMQNDAALSALLGDIHGYVAVRVSNNIPLEQSPIMGPRSKLSEVLRDMYLVPKDYPVGGGKKAELRTYLSYFLDITGKKPGEIEAYVIDRSKRFARPWYAKAVVQGRSDVGNFFHGGSKSAVLQNALEKFDEADEKNESEANAGNLLKSEVQQFLAQLNEKVI